MSTRSTIKIRRKDGTETGIYCHFDGYIEGVGITLQLAYNTVEKVEELLKLGDLSSLRYYTTPNEDSEHNFETSQENVCVAYHRDRGEEFRQSNGDNEYIYTFDQVAACWYVTEHEYVNKTKALKDLSIDYYWATHTRLLLDAIYECEIEDHWQDDEFAAAGHVKEACRDKAIEARREIIKEEAERFNAYYTAYCD